VIAFLLFLLLAGCTEVPERSAKAHPAWSRGERIGVASIPQRAGLDVTPDGQQVHVAWSVRGAKATQIIYLQLDQQANLLLQETVAPAGLSLLRHPAVIVQSDVVYLFFSGKQTSNTEAVFVQRMLPSVQTLSEPVMLTPSDHDVSGYDVLVSSEGIDCFWSTGEGLHGQLFYRRFDREGTPLTEATWLAMGSAPTAERDAAGGIHLAWTSPQRAAAQQILYAFFTPDQPIGPVAGTHISDIVTRAGILMKPLQLGLDTTHVYLVWSREFRTGLSAGTSEVEYVSFPIGQPRLIQPQTLYVPSIGEPEYTPRQDFFRIGPWVPLQGGVRGASDYLDAPWPLRGQHAELPVVLSASLRYRVHSAIQPILVIFTGGRPAGYQVIGRTQRLSRQTSVAADEQGNLYAIWLDIRGPGENDVYFASTAPAALARLDQTTSNDVLIGLAATLWGMVSGLGLVPLLGVQLLPLLVLIGVFYLSGMDDDLHGLAAQVTFLLGTGLYLVIKLLVMSPVLAFPPLMRQIPSELHTLWTWIVPFLLAFASGLVVYRYVRRSERPVLFTGLALFALTDGILTIMIYGPTFFHDI